VVAVLCAFSVAAQPAPSGPVNAPTRAPAVSAGMPSFAEAFDAKEVDQIHQYLIKRAHDLKTEGGAWDKFTAQ
ncbi:MAG: hypothetical protein ACLGJA_27215, partial [Gammaproteobacteria bacterium]